jgi:hypothetical protein
LDRYTPSGILPHSLQTSQGFSKRRVVEISGKVEGILQTPAGRIVSHEWQFEQKCLGSFRHARHYRKKSRRRILLLNEFRGLLRLYLSAGRLRQARRIGQGKNPWKDPPLNGKVRNRCRHCIGKSEAGRTLYKVPF